jgi:hypothetical protein
LKAAQPNRTTYCMISSWREDEVKADVEKCNYRISTLTTGSLPNRNGQIRSCIRMAKSSSHVDLIVSIQYKLNTSLNCFFLRLCIVYLTDCTLAIADLTAMMVLRDPTPGVSSWQKKGQLRLVQIFFVAPCRLIQSVSKDVACHNDINPILQCQNQARLV